MCPYLPTNNNASAYLRLQQVLLVRHASHPSMPGSFVCRRNLNSSHRNNCNSLRPPARAAVQRAQQQPNSNNDAHPPTVPPTSSSSLVLGLRMPCQAYKIECFTGTRSLYYLSSKSNSLPLIWLGSEVVLHQLGVLIIQFRHRK